MAETSKEKGIKMRERILEGIVKYMVAYRYPPTIREIGDMVGLKSNSSINNHLTRMKKQGMIDYLEGQARTITVPGIHYIDGREKKV